MWLPDRGKNSEEKYRLREERGVREGGEDARGQSPSYTDSQRVKRKETYRIKKGLKKKGREKAQRQNVVKEIRDDLSLKSR